MATITITANKNIDDCVAPMWLSVATGGTVGSYVSLNPQSGTWTASTLPTSTTWNSVCYGKNMAVAVAGAAGAGNTTYAAYTYDGITWAAATLPTSAHWKSVTYGNGYFVAIAYGGTATAYSTNGVNWTAGGALPSSANWEEITFGENTFVVVGGTTTGAYSTDNGLNWSSATMPTTTGYWSSVTYGNSKFVAVSYGAAHAATSADGITWDTIRTMPSSDNWKSVCYGAGIGGGLFMAVAYNTNKSATSADGITWGAVALSATANWQSVTYGVGNTTNCSATTPIFYARAYGATTTAYSTNGTSWTADTGVTGNITSSCYCPSMRGDTLVINDGAVITVNTDQAPRFRYINVTNGEFNITNASTASGIRFPLVRQTTGNTSDIITIYGLGSMNVTGDWIELGTGNGAANQTMTSWTNDSIPFVWVETGSGTGVYEKWGNITSQIDEQMYYGTKDLMTTVANGDGGKFFKQGLATEPATGFPTGGIIKDQFTTTLTFGDGTNGTVIPNGAKVKMPNIVLTDDSPIIFGNASYAYHANIDMQFSGSLVMDTCILSDFWIAGTQSKKLWLTSVGMAMRPILSKINNLIFTDVGLGELPASAMYVTGIRSFYESRQFSTSVTGSVSNQSWTYLNGAVFTNITSVHTLTAAVGTNSTGFYCQFQYCNDLVVDGFTSYLLNALWQNYIFHLDFVNTSLFENIKVYGGGYVVQNCTGTTVNGLEYLESFDNKNCYHGNAITYYPAYDKDKSGTAFADGTNYYFKTGIQRDANSLYSLVDSGYDYHIKPFTPTLATFPYNVSVLPGVARNDVYWVMTQYPRHNSPAIEVFWDTAVITASAVTTPIASPGIVYWTGHGLATDKTIVFSTSGALPTGITEGTTYYKKDVNANSFKISLTPGGADINFTGSTSGNHICTTGNRLVRSTSASTATQAHTSLSNGTTYYYVIRAHETAGNVLDVNCCDSASMEGTPQAARTFSNLCLQSRDLSNTTSWIGTNVGTRTAGVKYTSIPLTVDGTLLVATGNATLVQTITGLTAGDYIFHFQASDDGIGTSISTSVVSGANTTTTVCALKSYPQLYQVAITVPGGSTTAVITFGAGTTWTSGERIYIGNCNFALASQQLTNILTTTSAVTGLTTDLMSRVWWDWKNRVVLYSPNFQTTATNLLRVYNVITHTSTRGATMDRTDIISKGITQIKHSFINNVSCTFHDFKNSSLATRSTPANTTNAINQQMTIQNCANSTFTNFVFNGAAQVCSRALQIALGCKDLLIANWTIDEYRGFAPDVSTTYGQPITILNDNSGITFQNMKLGTKYSEGFYGFWGKDSIIKGVTGGNSANSIVPGLSWDSVQRDYTSVFDNNFFEMYSGTTDGVLALRFNDTELTSGSALSYSGSCGFDATGKWYAWDTDATLTMTIPYPIESITAFRNLTPQYFTTFWTSALNADRVLRPLALTVQYKINAGAWTDLTAANISAETITDAFTLAIKFIVNRVVEYDTEANGGFAVGNTIVGATSGATGVVEEILDQGTYGQLRISSYTLGGGTLPFVNNELLQVGGSTKGTVNQGTTYADNTFPNAGNYISALDIYTTIDQDVIYPPYTGGTLVLPTTITDGGDYVVTAPATIEFQGTATPTLWDLSSSTITTTSKNPITLINTSGAAITVAMETGLNLINTGTGLAAITVTSPPLERGQEFTGADLAGSLIKVFISGTTTEKFSTLISGVSETWDDATSGSINVDYVIMKAGYLPIRVTGVTLTGAVGTGIQTTPIVQTIDRAYVASSGLTWSEIALDTTNKYVKLNDVSTVQNLYSFLIEQWIDRAGVGCTGSELANVKFPMTANGSNSFSLIDDWETRGFTTAGTGISNTSLVNLSRDGLRYVNTAGTQTSVWSAILTSGVPSGSLVRYQQSDAGTTIDAIITSGNMDELVHVYGDASHGNFDKRGYLVLKVQEMGYDQAESNVVSLYGNIEDQLYVVGLAPTPNGVATGDPALSPAPTITQGTYVVDAKTFSIKIVAGAVGQSGEDILRWLRYNFETGGTFESENAFNWHDLVRTNGSSYKTVNGIVYGTATTKGVLVYESDGTTLHGDFNLFTADNGTTYAPPATLNIDLSGFVSGTRLQLQDTLNNVELFNDIVAATTKNYTEIYSVDRTIRVRASYVNGTSAKSFVEMNLGNLDLTTQTITRNLEQIDDSIYNTIGIDGSSITEISISGNGIDIYVDDIDNELPGQRIYSWYCYYLFTEDGIRDSSNYIRAIDITNFRVSDNGVTPDLVIANIAYTPLSIINISILPETSTISPTAILDQVNSNSDIMVNSPVVVGFPYSSGSGLDPTQSTYLTTIYNKTLNIVDDIPVATKIDANNGALIKVLR